MYHCHIHFYLIGHQCEVFETIKEMSPLEHFTHKFSESDEPDEVLVSEANVIFVNLQNLDVEKVLQTLILNKNSEAKLILFADKKQIMLFTNVLSEVNDIWMMPMLDEEIRFRFLRWQQNYKMGKDFWQTNQYLESTINNIPNLVWYKDKNGIHKKVNDSFCKTVNKTKKQVEGRGHAYIWDVEHDDPACIESEREVMTKRTTCISEETIVTGDGERLLKTYKSPLYDVDNSVMGTVGVAIDVTQERDYEQEIIKKKHTLETIFTTIDCGIMCHTIDGSQIVNINKAALKILGYNSKEELMDTGFDMIAATVVEEDREQLRKSISGLKNEGDSVSVEYSIRHADGEILHIMGNVKLIEENGKLYYQRFLLDCTTQKLQEKKERLKNEKRHMELIQALSIDFHFVCFIDLDTDVWKMLRMNDDKNIFAYTFANELSIEENVERYIQNYVYTDDQEMIRQVFSKERLMKELKDKKTFSINYRMFYNGEMQYFQMKIVRAGTWESNHGVVVGFRNVDKETRKEMEEKNLLEELLSQANQANEAKSVFLSNMSHDIRTPMNAIVGFTNLAITHIDQMEQVEEYLKKIQTSGNHLLSLINDVLDMSRIESGKVHLEEEPCSLPDILYGLYNIVQSNAQEKGLELHIDTEDILDEEFYCDKLRLNQVLLNLLSNAIKYTNEGGLVSFKITEKSGAPTGFVNYEFCIKDTGIGMSKEFVSRIFEPFERERNSTISRIQGTGLGMAITKNIVDMMKGSIAVKSKQGVGTEIIVSFTFRLNTEAKTPQAIPEFKNCKALVINDDFSTCESISYMLRKLGMCADQALSGEEALSGVHQAMSNNESYGVYIIDCQLSDMSGMEVTRRIREEMHETVPFIIMTTYDQTNIEKEAKEAGVTAFCNKPLFLSKLRKCLYSIVNADEEKEKSISRESMNLHTGRILLVEDIELNQELAVVILEGAGYCTEVAGNGQIAVDMLKKSEPGYYQLVLMDIQMPVMNGYEATKAIRQLENKELASIPIIAMSANAFEEDKQEALKCGMNGHVAKPIDVKNLLDTLNNILDSNS